MASPAQFAANAANAQSSTGPRTEAGKQASSHNALAHGLFAARDFVLPADRAEYTHLAASLRVELMTEGFMEENYAAEIVTATWRLRRCGQIEASLGERFPFDPMTLEDPEAARIQTSVDRARSQALNALRRATAELRALQTERAARNEALENRDDPPLASTRELYKVLAARQRLKKLHAPHQPPARPILRFSIEDQIEAELAQLRSMHGLLEEVTQAA
jgi:hypothetical protein